MKKNQNGMPTANIAINKSRLKLYKGEIPTYYLKPSSEFQIELFNPTKGMVLAKIKLNSKLITQGGLILRPGERVFLERYIDIPKKFKFDTYEVSGNNDEVKKAIEDNGDFEVQFYKEKIVVNDYPTLVLNGNITRQYTQSGGANKSNFTDYTRGSNINTTGTPYPNDITFTTSGLGNSTSTNNTNNLYNTNISSSNVSMDWMEPEMDTQSKPKKLRSRTVSKKIETGRVEEGSTSNQKMEYLKKNWEYFSFHSVEYKLLPLSQKINTSEDITIKSYCTSCSKKSKKGDNFCGKCGHKI